MFHDFPCTADLTSKQVKNFQLVKSYIKTFMKTHSSFHLMSLMKNTHNHHCLEEDVLRSPLQLKILLQFSNKLVILIA